MNDSAAEDKARAEKARSILQAKVTKAMAAKPKLVYKPEIKSYVPPTAKDIPVGSSAVPEDNLYVQDHTTGEHVKAVDFKNTLEAQFGKHIYYD